ncbi:hypothetical protein [Francisella hispaniensis]|uniref:Uncharacterized protein n=1 Tax=Francisella hispaniensis FSC454 TaxID=1088883 RepID=A0AAC9J6J3_9GAMM|nr:hypothetical protein [Francisella hispaniensis]APD50673.1 hypothetical protein FSC454_05875 [Francisella hispaniensis FSC454]KYW82580.1 hypothetical protein AUF42_08290 [Francisella hispaniensis FSC454]
MCPSKEITTIKSNLDCKKEFNIRVWHKPVLLIIRKPRATRGFELLGKLYQEPEEVYWDPDGRYGVS